MLLIKTLLKHMIGNRVKTLPGMHFRFWPINFNLSPNAINSCFNGVFPGVYWTFLLISGSDINLGMKIQINFVKSLSASQRRMIAHTCACILDFPETYASPIEMRSEITAFLNSGMWDMDFV